MKGFWKMLTGQGEKEYREQHRDFDDAIPNDYPFRAGGYVRYGPGDNDYRPETPADYHLPVHPAYSSKFGNTSDGMNYRRAHSMHGPQSRQEHKRFSATQRMLAQYEKEARVSSYMTDPGFLAWLEEKAKGR